MQRRGFLFGLGAALTAPAIVKAESLMKIAKLRGDGVSLMSIAHPGGRWVQGYDRLIVDDPWMADIYEFRTIEIAYRITREAIENNLLNKGHGGGGLIVRSRLREDAI